ARSRASSLGRVTGWVRTSAGSIVRRGSVATGRSLGLGARKGREAQQACQVQLDWPVLLDRPAAQHVEVLGPQEEADGRPPRRPVVGGLGGLGWGHGGPGGRDWHSTRLRLSSAPRRSLRSLPRSLPEVTEVTAGGHPAAVDSVEEAPHPGGVLQGLTELLDG